MSSHQGLPSFLPPLEQVEYVIHTVNIAPLSLLLGTQYALLFLSCALTKALALISDLWTASMDPETLANPHAEFVTECFQQRPALKNSSWDRSPTTRAESMLVKVTGWCDVEGPAGDKEGGLSSEDKVVEGLFEADNVSPSSRNCFPGLAG